MTVPNREIAVYALYLLGGTTKRVHTERVAQKCFELVPDAFSWTLYPDYPDKDVVRVALTDARKEKNGRLVEGRSGQNRGQFQKTKRLPVADGWSLTDEGINWIEAEEPRLRSLGGEREVREHRQKTLQFLGRVKRHTIFQSYLANENEFSPSIGELADLLRCRVDADPAVWLARFERLRKSARAVSDQEVIGFLTSAAEAYEDQR